MRRVMSGLFVAVAFGLVAVVFAASSFDGKWTARVIRPAPPLLRPHHLVGRRRWWKGDRLYLAIKGA